MKKLILSLAVIAMASGAFSKDKVTITNSNEPSGTYGKVTETHEENNSGGKDHTLDCRTAGSTECKFIIKPTVNGPSIDVILNEVDNSGALSGSFTMDNANVTWFTNEEGTRTIDVIYN